MPLYTDRSVMKQLGTLFDYMISEHHRGNWGMDIEAWDWVPGVGLISLMEYASAEGRKDVLEYVQHWIARNRHRAEQVKVINAMAPYTIFPDLYRHTQEPWLLDQAQRIADWMMEEAPRTREGALEHTVTEAVEFREQVWADTVYMAVMFLARLAETTGEKDLAEFALQQTLIHLRLLQNPDTGLLYHGWNSGESGHMSAVHWARANAWITLAVPDILAGISGIVPIPEELRSRYRLLAEGLRSCQATDGLWHTVLDRPDFYKETSGSAGIACGFIRGVRGGLLDSSFLDNARLTVEGIRFLIGEDGEVHGVSGGTPVMPSAEAYNEIPLYPTLYGQGLVMQLWTQALHL